MTQSNLLQTQAERIEAIIEADISGVSVAQFPPASIDTRLPVVVITVASTTYQKQASKTYNVSVEWDLWLYLKSAGASLDMVNQVDLYTYLDKFANAFLSRPDLKLDGANLAYCKDSDFQLVSALSGLQRYPPRNGQALFWGCQYRLTTYSLNVTLHNVY